ncbi:MAG: CerR family C-terminal domain-containing protein [Nitratireductor sp.]
MPETSVEKQQKQQKTVLGSTTGPEATREALIAAALDLFGANGFDATSTREIASRAGANIASIAYHFGGKEGLRQACAQSVRSQIDAIMASAFARSSAAIAQPASPDIAANMLEAIMGHVVRAVLISPDAARFVPFVLREINDHSPVLDTLYRDVMEPTHRRLCALWGAAIGAEPESEAVRLAVFAMVGQIIYFRIGAQIVTRRMGWSKYTASEADQIADTVCANLRASLKMHKTAKTGKERP